MTAETDLISRQAAIDAVNRALDRETLLNRFVRKVAIDAIRIVPSVQPTIMRPIGELVGYTGEPCPNCGRLRVERYESGLEICEKCNWCEQTKSYWLDGV